MGTRPTRYPPAFAPIVSVTTDAARATESLPSLVARDVQALAGPAAGRSSRTRRVNRSTPRTVTESGQGAADQFQVCQTVAEPLVAGRFHSLESQTRPPDDGSGSGVAPE